MSERGRLGPAVLVLVLSLAGGACEAPDELDELDELDGGPGPLVDVEAWSPSPASADPLAAHRPLELLCPAAAWKPEFGSLEVDTGQCNYLSVEQPLLRDVPAGAPVVVNLWHQALHAELDALGHVALVVGDTLIWERTVAIPGPAEVWSDEVLAPRDLLAGERVVFHLHNHGANTWNLGEVRRGP